MLSVIVALPAFGFPTPWGPYDGNNTFHADYFA
jgi:hypothetical protein